MTYYHQLITEKSWQVLRGLKKEYHFILIGGWAVFLYTQGLKSKDIDLVIDYSQLAKLKEKLGLVKNNRLKKYETRKEEIEIDIYVPFYSNPGLPAEEIDKYRQIKSGFWLPKKEVLLILKQHAYQERKNSVKGRKDILDIFSLLLLDDFDWEEYQRLIFRYKKEKLLRSLKKALETTFEAPELDLNKHKFKRLKKKWLENLRKA